MMTRKEAEQVRNEAKRTGDVTLIRQWNDWCAAETARLARKDTQVFAIAGTYRALWGG